MQTDNLEKIEKSALASEFKVVWEILNALMEQDADLADAVKKIGSDTIVKSGHNIPFDPLFEFMQIDGNINGSIQDLINVHVLHKLISNWDKMFVRLCDYKEKHNTTKPSKNIDLELYLWTNQQRGRKNFLSPTKITSLNEIGFDWTPLLKTWHERFEELLEFKEAYGHYNIPTRDPFWQQLSSWYELTRQKFYDNELPKDRLKLLKDAKVSFEKKDVRAEKIWQARFEELIEYVYKHNSLWVPQRYGLLGRWCNRQRSLYKLGKLPKSREEKLTNLGFSFDPLEDLWHQRFNEYKDSTEGQWGKELSSWASYQRKALKKGTLSNDKILLLRSINFEFNLSYDPATRGTILASKNWQLLVDFKKTHGHCNVPSNTTLYKWVNQVRIKNKEGKLSELEKVALNGIGFPWRHVSHTEVIEFEKLADEYAILTKKGHKLPEHLAKWLAKVYFKKKRRHLTLRHRNKLKEIGFDFNTLPKRLATIKRVQYAEIQPMGKI